MKLFFLNIWIKQHSIYILYNEKWLIWLKCTHAIQAASQKIPRSLGWHLSRILLMPEICKDDFRNLFQRMRTLRMSQKEEIIHSQKSPDEISRKRKNSPKQPVTFGRNWNTFHVRNHLDEGLKRDQLCRPTEHTLLIRGLTSKSCTLLAI